MCVCVCVCVCVCSHTHSLSHGLAHFFYKGPDRKYFKLCGQDDKSQNYSTHLFNSKAARDNT